MVLVAFSCGSVVPVSVATASAAPAAAPAAVGVVASDDRVIAAVIFSAMAATTDVDVDMFFLSMFF